MERQLERAVSHGGRRHHLPVLHTRVQVLLREDQSRRSLGLSVAVDQGQGRQTGLDSEAVLGRRGRFICPGTHGDGQLLRGVRHARAMGHTAYERIRRFKHH